MGRVATWNGQVKSVLSGLAAPMVDFILPPCCTFCGLSADRWEPSSDDGGATNGRATTVAGVTEPVAIVGLSDAEVVSAGLIPGGDLDSNRTGTHARAGCTADAAHDSTPIALCPGCRKVFDNDTREACRRCGLPVGPYVSTEGPCINCARRTLRFDSVIRLGIYQDELRDACVRGKSVGSEALASALGGLLWLRYRSRLAELNADVITAVPQYWLHRITRRHHQAVTIAEELAARIDVPFDPMLVRKTRLTPDQSSLHRAERLENLKNAFTLHRGRDVRGRRVLLVDDILTTGTTSSRVAAVLKAAGAASVTVAVIAVVP